MCGRFVSASSPDTIAEYFGAAFGGDTLGDNFNVAPTNDVYGVVAEPTTEAAPAAPAPAAPAPAAPAPAAPAPAAPAPAAPAPAAPAPAAPAPAAPAPAAPATADAAPSAETGRRLEVFQWGLIPSWAKDRKIGSKMINARAETLGEKPAFKGVFRKHRCIIPMDGFYEWRAATEDSPLDAKGKPRKQPMYIHRIDGEPLAVAGLWARWKDPAAESDDGADNLWLHSATVVTTSANATMRPVHDRMPVILPRSVWPEWLDPDMHDTERLSELLVPAADDILTMHPVSTDVNRVSNKGEELIVPIDIGAGA